MYICAAKLATWGVGPDVSININISTDPLVGAYTFVIAAETILHHTHAQNPLHLKESTRSHEILVVKNGQAQAPGN